MAISYIGSASGIKTVSIPAHQRDDLIIIFAFRDGNVTAPALPAGWTNIRFAGANACSGRIGYKLASSSSEVSGTWANASSVVCAVYRGVNRATPIGGNSTSAAASTNVTYNTVTMANSTGSSWVVGVAGHRAVNTNLQNAPTGMTNRINVVDAADEASLHDTNGGVTSWAATSVAVAGTSAGWRSFTVELLAEAAFSTTEVYATSWFDGNTTTPNNALGAADGTFTEDTTGFDWYGQWNMGNPGHPLNGRLQRLEITCRSHILGASYLDSVDIYYNNVYSESATLTNINNTVISTTGQVLTYTFPAHYLSSGTDMAQIGIYAVKGTAILQIDSIKWIAYHDEIPPTSGTLKYWTGSAWAPKTLKYWTGSSWV